MLCTLLMSGAPRPERGNRGPATSKKKEIKNAQRYETNTCCDERVCVNVCEPASHRETLTFARRQMTRRV